MGQVAENQSRPQAFSDADHPHGTPSRGTPRQLGIDQSRHEGLYGPEGIRVLIAYEVRVIQESLDLLLRHRAEVKVVTLPHSGKSHRQEERRVDVVLIDATQGLEAVANRIQEFRNTWPNAKMIVVGVSETASEVLGYIETGVSGYVCRGGSVEELVETIQAVYRGEASSSPNILALLFERIASLKSQLKAVEGSDLNKLTQRELEVLQLVTNGMSNKEIGAHLKLELQTVKNHVHSILEKLRVRNRREAAAYAQKPTIPEGPSSE